MEGALSRLWRLCASKLSSWTQGYSGFTLSLTGILGLAAVLVGLYHFRLLRGPSKRREEPGSDPDQPSTSASAAAAAGAGPSSSSRAKPGQAPGGTRPTAAAAAAAAPAASRLGGPTVLTISVPGVLLEEQSPAELEESATVCSEAAAVLRQVLSGGARGTQVYLLAHVEDDIGEAVVRGALEHAGLVGPAAGQLPPHRLLFCGTLQGKVSVVRQIEPEWHFDAHPDTVKELARFQKRLVFVADPAAAPALATPGNVQRVPTFAAFFGL